MRTLFVSLLVMVILAVTSGVASSQASTPVGQTKKDNPQNVKQPAVEVKVTLAGKTGGDITKKEFHDAKQLVVTSADNDSSWELKTVRAAIAGKGIQYFEFELRDGIIPHNMDSIISKAPSSVKLYFEYLTVIRKRDNLIRPINPLEFTVVE